MILDIYLISVVFGLSGCLIFIRLEGGIHEDEYDYTLPYLLIALSAAPVFNIFTFIFALMEVRPLEKLGLFLIKPIGPPCPMSNTE